MLIPRFWAESKLRHRAQGKQLTLQRWGWSSASQEEAQALADARVRIAMDEAITHWGQPVPRKREPKVAYNGADGVPVREEIVEEREDGVVTRNGYGSLCLNVADVMFVDIDEDYVFRLPRGSVRKVAPVALAVGLLVAVFSPTTVVAVKGFLMAFFAAWMVGYWAWHGWHLASVRRRGGAIGLARSAVQAMLPGAPASCWDLYRTPRGARLLALHALFDPKQDDVQALMKQLHADPVYAVMCRAQDSFRARVSPKPWRIPAWERMRGPVWPVVGEALERRTAWVAGYDARHGDFASCALVERLGSGVMVDKAARVKAWHDQMSQAATGKPLA